MASCILLVAGGGRVAGAFLAAEEDSEWKWSEATGWIWMPAGGGGWVWTHDLDWIYLVEFDGAAFAIHVAELALDRDSGPIVQPAGWWHGDHAHPHRLYAYTAQAWVDQRTTIINQVPYSDHVPVDALIGHWFNSLLRAASYWSDIFGFVDGSNTPRHLLNFQGNGHFTHAIVDPGCIVATPLRWTETSDGCLVEADYGGNPKNPVGVWLYNEQAQILYAYAMKFRRAD